MPYNLRIGFFPSDPLHWHGPNLQLVISNRVQIRYLQLPEKVDLGTAKRLVGLSHTHIRSWQSDEVTSHDLTKLTKPGHLMAFPD